MIGVKRFLGVLLLGMVVAAWTRADTPLTVTVPVSGEYWEAAAEGMLVYSGAVTIEWIGGGGNGQWPVRATLLGQAWCRNSGAGYTLYGLALDSLGGAPGSPAMLTLPMLAVGGNGMPAFDRNISLSVALGGPTSTPSVTEITFGGR